MQDYAGAVSGERGRCFRFVTDPDGKPVNCPERVIASGWLKIGDRWHEVDACGTRLSFGCVADVGRCYLRRGRARALRAELKRAGIFDKEER